MNASILSSLAPRITLVWAYLASLFALGGLQARVFYVTPTATTSHTAGTGWGSSANLQSALSSASSGDQIWLKEGVYYPDEGTGQTNNNQGATFRVLDGVTLFGGFSGSETSLGQRNVEGNPTILSGDIAQDDINLDGNFIAEMADDIQGTNALHVIRTSGTAGSLISASLDGLIITAGDADHPVSRPLGGGIDALYCNLALTDCILSGNRADEGGGLSCAGNLVATNCSIIGNSS